MGDSITIAPRQSLLDIALQVYGQPEAIFDIAMLNDIAITDNLQSGNKLIVCNTTPSRIATIYYANGIKPATAITEIDQANTFAGEGIEFWAIETEFIIS